MTELEQVRKAYAGLVGRVDTIITRLDETGGQYPTAAEELKKALQEAEEIFLSEDPDET